MMFVGVDRQTERRQTMEQNMRQNVFLGRNSKVAIDQEWVDNFQRKYLLESSPHEQAELIAQFPHLANLLPQISQKGHLDAI